MYFRINSYVKAFIELTKADNYLYAQLFIKVRSILVITSKYYFKTYFIDPCGARTPVLLLVYSTPKPSGYVKITFNNYCSVLYHSIFYYLFFLNE